MPTINVNLRYRPIRIGWCVPEGDRDAVRKALRLTHALWGGAYNPIIPISDSEQTKAEGERLVRAFHVDLLWSVNAGSSIDAFVEKHAYLRWEHFESGGEADDHARGRDAAKLLTVRTAYTYWSRMLTQLQQTATEQDRARMQRKVEERTPVRLTWEPSDPLADYFLATFGELDDQHRSWWSQWKDHSLASRDPLNGRYGQVSLDHVPMSLHRLTRVRLEAKCRPADLCLMCGDLSQVENLIAYWNLRASGENVLFLDAKHLDRISAQVGALIEKVSQAAGEQTVYWRDAGGQLPPDVERKLLDAKITVVERHAPVDDPGCSYFEGQKTILAMVEEAPVPETTLGLPSPLDLPELADDSFSREALVVSLGLEDDRFPWRNQDWLLIPPNLPKLNQQYEQLVEPRQPVRSEPRRIGVIIHAARTHLRIRAISPDELFKWFSEAAALSFRVSDAGQKGKHIIRKMGGLHHCAIFRNRGVRELLKTDIPSKANGKGFKHPVGTITKHCPGSDQTAKSVLAASIWKRLLEREVFRIGAVLECEQCRLKDWYPLSRLDTWVKCDFCGATYNAAMRLEPNWAYRLSGIFAPEKLRNDNKDKGTVPVILALGQLSEHVGSDLLAYSAGAMLTTTGGAETEVDLVAVVESTGRRVELVLGECKTGGELKGEDLSRLKRVRQAFSKEEIDVYLLLAKTDELREKEIQLLPDLDSELPGRIIVLTEEDLAGNGLAVPEPEEGSRLHALARVTMERALALA